MAYLGNQITTSAFITDQFSGTGSQTAFTMSVAPAGSTSVLVSVSGVLQDPSTYAVNSTTLQFSSAPPVGTGNISVRYLGIPASGVTNTAYRTVTEFTATAGQTTFSVPSYTVGFINVYRNGVRLGGDDFTATSGVSIVLAAGAFAGDLIVTESFYVSSVLNAIPAATGAVNTGYIADNAIVASKIADSSVTQNKIANGAVVTSKYADASVTPAKLSQPLTLGTAATASGTSVDFTGIPSWVKRITVMFNGVSISGGNLLVQLGISSGVVNTGYIGRSANIATTPAVGITNSTAGFPIREGTTVNAHMIITNISGNSFISSHVSNGVTTSVQQGSGSVTLSGVLDRVRITTTTGTDTFTAGSINIMYEG